MTGDRGRPTRSVQALTLGHVARNAAQVTLDKGNEWFEIASKIDAKNMQTLVIVMGKGETLAGGPKQYNAKETLAASKGKIG